MGVGEDSGVPPPIWWHNPLKKLLKFYKKICELLRACELKLNYNTDLAKSEWGYAVSNKTERTNTCIHLALTPTKTLLLLTTWEL